LKTECDLWRWDGSRDGVSDSYLDGRAKLI